MKDIDVNSNTIVMYGPNTNDFGGPWDDWYKPIAPVSQPFLPYPPIDALPVIPMKPRKVWEDNVVEQPTRNRTLTERVFALEGEVAQLKREIEALRATVGHDTIPCSPSAWSRTSRPDNYDAAADVDWAGGR